MKKNGIKITVAGLAAVMSLSALSSVYASAAVVGQKEGATEFLGHEITTEAYYINGCKVDCKYSDGFFENEPAFYQHHMATASNSLAQASCTVIDSTGFKNGPSRLIELMKDIGFENVTASDSYYQEPTTDSIACAFGTRNITTVCRGERKVISIVIRSANYEKEWASNVTLGSTGEAAGFANAADQVVDTYLKKYIEDNDLEEDLKEGRVDFWISGYSRGGATANLTAKRLIDAHHANGNKVYAYCIEAPQGGVAEAEKEGSDYTGIHNVINLNDLVPYVAPTEMGFKRYGVDHYLSSANHDASTVYGRSIFLNNAHDNSDTRASDEQIEKVRAQIRYMVPDLDKQAEYMPYTVTYKKLNLNLKDRIKIEDKAGDGKDDSFINRMVNGLVKKAGYIALEGDHSGDLVTRDVYITKHVQDALRHFMQFIYEKGSLSELINTVNPNDLVIAALKENWPALTSGTKIYSKSFLENIKGLIFGSDEAHFQLDLSEENKRKIADSITEELFRNSAFKEMLDEQEYPGGSSAAKSDIQTLLREFMRSVQDIDPLLTFATNINGIFQNHASFQTAGWLRSYDSWFESEAEEETTPAHEKQKTLTREEMGKIFLNSYTKKLDEVSDWADSEQKENTEWRLNNQINAVKSQFGLK